MFKNLYFTLALVLFFTEKNTNKINCQRNTKLNIEVYYETLCPDSKRFINNQVSKIYQNSLLQNITNVILIPYGKASVTLNLSFCINEIKCYKNQYYIFLSSNGMMNRNIGILIVNMARMNVSETEYMY
jgi:hypothetical protein